MISVKHASRKQKNVLKILKEEFLFLQKEKTIQLNQISRVDETEKISFSARNVSQFSQPPI